MTDEAKLKNVRHELAELTAVCQQAVPESPEEEKVMGSKWREWEAKVRARKGA